MRLFYSVNTLVNLLLRSWCACTTVFGTLFFCFVAASAQQRTVIIDQDGVGPGGSDMQSIVLMLQAPDVKVLGITVVSGDVWADTGSRHIRRALELVGRTDVPVYSGSNVPLIRTPAETTIHKALYGKAWYQGALGVRFQ